MPSGNELRLLAPLLLVAVTGCATAPLSGPETLPGSVSLPNPEAPSELQQFGRFVGKWQCSVERADAADPSAAMAGAATWVWSYAMEGFAIQDLWLPAGGGESSLSTATGLRVYDRDTGSWRVAWTSVDRPEFSLFDATLENGDMVMTGQTTEFDLRMVFTGITDREFAWFQEARERVEDAAWLPIARMRCSRVVGNER
jgi:hypothetical protein